MAIKHGFTITPVANIGPDEMWDIRWDRDDIADTWVESLLPRPERLYIAFGEPFDTRPFAGREDDRAVLDAIKDAVQAQLEELIKEALLQRARRRHDMHWLRRLLARY